LKKKEDLILIKKIYKKLKNKNNFTLVDILKLIEHNRGYLKINEHIKQKITKDLQN